MVGIVIDGPGEEKKAFFFLKKMGKKNKAAALRLVPPSRSPCRD